MSSFYVTTPPAHGSMAPDGWGIGGALFTAPSGTSGWAFFISSSVNRETSGFTFSSADGFT